MVPNDQLKTEAPFLLQAQKFHKLLDSRDAPFLREHVRHISFRRPLPTEFIIAVLSACDATINLALPDSRFLFPCLEHLPMQRLSVDVHALFHPAPPSFTHPLFAHVTHLDLRE
jgi:hypothetical protein